MKQLKPYLMFSALSCAIAVFLSVIFHFSLSNTWQAGVAIAFIFGPYLLFGWKYSKQINEKNHLLYVIIRFGIIMFVFGYILSTILILF